MHVFFHDNNYVIMKPRVVLGSEKTLRNVRKASLSDSLEPNPVQETKVSPLILQLTLFCIMFIQYLKSAVCIRGQRCIKMLQWGK